MSNTEQYTTRALNDCGCCDGTKERTPMAIRNRSGLHAIAYRLGEHSRFKQSMLARLSSSGCPNLADLKSRDDDDFSIALLDSWATVADVLTFYQERIANESYLRTATERLSLLEMSLLIGYKLNPGVAASTYLAFTMEEAPGDPEKATQSTIIDIGSKVQSTPGPGEQAQTYETIEKIKAHVAHNAIRPRLTIPQEIFAGVRSITIQGTNNNIRPGDIFLIVLESNISVRILKQALKVSVDQDNQTSTIDFVVQNIPYIFQTNQPGKVIQPGKATTTKLSMNALNVGKVVSMNWAQNDLKVQAAIQKWPLAKLGKVLKEVRSQSDQLEDAEVYVFRQRASVFGYNAPRYNVTYTGDKINQIEWSRTKIKIGKKVYLDRVYDEVVPGSYAAIHTNGEFIGISKIIQVETRTRTAYGISGQASLLTLGLEKNGEDDGPEYKATEYEKSEIIGLNRSNGLQFKVGPGVITASHQSTSSLDYEMREYKGDKLIVAYGDNLHEIRTTTLDVQSEKLDLAEIPILKPIAGDSVILNDLYPSLEIGQRIILTGEPVDSPGITESEVLELADVRMEEGFTGLRFKTALQHAYKRDSVIIHGNVAPATHGESAHEILGSGDGRKAFQQFVLKQKPLTYASAATPGGAESTLEVRVNDLLWEEVDNLYDRGPNEHVYITRIDDNGNTFIQFGDGKSGARLPSGENNVRARYRKGVGLEGLVNEKQLNLLMTRPLGVKDAVNPIAASGADDPESRDEARANAPLTVLTLDRTVSLRDYEDFARAFAGIAKAQAVRSWDGQVQRMFITVAAPKGGDVKQGSSVYENLSTALQKAGDPYVNFAIQSYRKAFFRIEGGLHLDPRYLPDKVLNEVNARLKEHFSFEQRNFGQPVMLNEVIALIQTVSGVVAADIDRLYRFGNNPALNHRLIAGPAGRAENGEMFAAELLTLDLSSLSWLKVLS